MPGCDLACYVCKRPASAHRANDPDCEVIALPFCVVDRHGHCLPPWCEVMAIWRPRILRVTRKAITETGRPFAVVLCNDDTVQAKVTGTYQTLRVAKPQRTRAGRSLRPDNPKAVAYVVCIDGHLWH